LQAQVEERESEAAALREEMAGMAEQLKQVIVTVYNNALRGH
jgi:hypothetical protein